MRVAIFGKKFDENFIPSIQFLLNKLTSGKADIFVYEPFAKFLYSKLDLPTQHKLFSSTAELIEEKVELLFSIGGDGTILDAITIIQKSGIPILGINTGRLGFLSSIAREDIGSAVDNVLERNYTLEARSLVSLETKDHLFGNVNYALNEITVMKTDSSSMVTIHTYVDGVFLNSYWADGVIIATPTGSTAYSLSCGGPILVPTANNFIVTPISPHNLNVRPIVVKDTSNITLKIEGRDENFLIALDSRSNTVGSKEVLELTKADFSINLAKMPSENFNQTLRNKLMWGLDKRN
jgi:NAD+ kinase